MTTVSSNVILVIHERGAPEHYRGLEAAAEKLGVPVVYVEFSLLRMLAKAILRRDRSMLMRTFRSAATIFPLLLGRRWNGPIVLGVAPFDVRMLLLLRVFKNNKVHVHSSWPYWDLTFHPHRYYSDFVLWVWRKALRDRAAGMYFVTDQCKNNFNKSQFSGVKTTVVYHSFDENIYQSDHVVRREAREVLTVGYVGRLEVDKGIDRVLDLACMEYSTRVVFKIAGSGTLREKVSMAASVQDNVSYVGHLGDQMSLAEFYASLDILVVPSRKAARWEELFGMVIIEAMACGVYPIATDHVGPREIIQRAQFGSIISEDGFVDAVHTIIDNYPKDSSELKKRRDAAKAAAEPYGRMKIARHWLEQIT